MAASSFNPFTLDPPSDPTQDPFSPLFSGPFQGIPTRNLSTDTLTYQLFLLPSASEASALESSLTTLKTSIESLVQEWVSSTNYVFQRSPFSISLISSTPGLPAHLSGSLPYGDSIDDLWFISSLLVSITKTHPSIYLRLTDTDGEFLLIEAAHALPRWLTPEVSENRVWINDGKLYIIPLVKGGKRELSLSEAVEFLSQCTPESLLRDKNIEKEAMERMKGYPAKAATQRHRARVIVPRAVAGLLRERPDAVAAAVESFYIRDPISLQAVKKKEKMVPWVDPVEVTVGFTKVLWAQMKGQIWEAPRGSGYPVASPENGKLDVGVKLTAGFEMLLARENDVLLESGREELVEELRGLVEKGIKGPTDEECKQGEVDSEDWLHIDFTEFEKDLKGEGGAEGAYGDPEQEEKLKRMVERFEKFLNDDTAGHEGAKFGFNGEGGEDDEDDEELNSDDDVDSEDLEEGEDKDISFDEKEFERMMREMMGLPGDAAEDGDDDGKEEEKEIHRIQDQIEAELRAAGVMETQDVPKIREIGPDEDSDEADDPNAPISIDYALAKNLLESFKGQAGLSGPGGNLLASLGIQLPRDEPGAEEPKGKGKAVEQ
ncbi:SGT1 protein-domain-containing protein [Pyronema domesticum]|uniref:Similar to Protein SGT1 homolog acc. no. Q9CS74 n=1 Tax=Pyronema omphalodes (strain CBS 100304) TaxID=1076935 RepID=U4LLE5_PYROM|nr:SGT1 protein-domain-containing protein [Pyronema domesticum]CCX32939.1 Similar to Protein SGT1 homolog; acc. no. Q9CS74 [Pyronema omphalodes CBS 100304]